MTHNRLKLSALPALSALLLVSALGTCDYACGIGYLANEYRKEQAELRERLEQCGTCAEGERCNVLLEPARCRPEKGVEGDPCGAWRDRDEYDFVCEPPLVCNQALEPDSCAPLGEVGAACAHTGDCSADTWCHEWKCVPSRPLGAACEYDDEVCRPNTCLDSTNTCEVPRAMGEACMSAQDCAGNLACSDEKRCYDPHSAQP